MSRSLLALVPWALVLIAPSALAAPAEGVKLEEIIATGALVDLVTVDLRKARLRLLWRRKTGEAFAGLGAARDWLTQQGERPVALTNAGIYGTDDRPLGLHVEEGAELHEINLERGAGNFYLLPNGVFAVKGTEAMILESNAYGERAKSGGPRPQIATQSGPLLVAGGQLHKGFVSGAASRKIRSGIGVRSNHEVVIAVSRDPMSFHEFAVLFRDRLGCADALYLDGTISRLEAPGLGRSASGLLGEPHFVGILAVLTGN
jgi:uncharacterized protein YigE (DUF2233 family)